MMIRPKMGFIVFGVHKDGLKDPLGVPFINQKIIDESKAAIEAKGVELVENEIVVAYKQEAREALAKLKHDDSVDGVILFSGTWVWASEIVAAVRDFERAGKGVIIWTVPRRKKKSGALSGYSISKSHKENRKRQKKESSKQENRTKENQK